MIHYLGSLKSLHQQYQEQRNLTPFCNHSVWVRPPPLGSRQWTSVVSWQTGWSPASIPQSRGFHVQLFFLSTSCTVKSGDGDRFALRSRCLRHIASCGFISSLKMRFLGFWKQRSNDQFHRTAHVYNSTEDCSWKCEAIAYCRHTYLNFQPVK